MKNLIIVSMGFICFGIKAQSIPNPPRQVVYDDQTVSSIFISIPPDSLAAIFNDVTSDKEYKSQFIFDHNGTKDTIEEVGFRLRGNTSRYSGKKSYKISFNTYNSGKRWNGVKGLNINGEHNDPSISRARICWDLLEDLGLASARTNHVKLYINNSYYGVYANVEHINDDFVLQRFGDDSGNLYKCLWPATLEYISNNPSDYKFTSGGRRAYDLKTNSITDDYSDLSNFINVLNNTSIANLPCALESIFDVNEYLYYLAFEIAIGHWDNHAYNKNNFYLYQNPEDGLMHYIPFDLDNTLGIDWVGEDWANRNINNWGNIANYNALYQRVLSIPEYKFKMQLLLKVILQHMTTNSFINKGLNIRSQVSNHIKNDIFYTYDYGYDSVDFWQSWTLAAGGHVDYGINTFIGSRNTSATNQFLSGNSKPILIGGLLSGKSNKAPIVATVYAKDESPLAQVGINYREIGDNNWTSVILADNGLGEDKIAGDGNYSGIIQPSITSSGIEYYWTALDIMGQSSDYPCSFHTHLLHSKMPVIINELMSKNNNYILDQNGDDSDWIELYNPTGTNQDLINIYISDKSSIPGLYHLKDLTIPANGHLMLWASSDTGQYDNHLPFKLSGNGETVKLYSKESNGSFVSIDEIKFPAAGTDQSFGRKYDGSAQWVTFKDYPTPNSNNSGVLNLDNELRENKPFPYPNPHSNHIYFNNTWNNNADIYLHNQLGQLIYKGRINANQKLKINNSGPSGMYILTVKYENNTFRFKLNKL